MGKKKQGEVANCIIFHNFSTEVDAKVLFEYLENFCIINGVTPTRSGYDSPHLPRSRSTKTFKHGKKVLYETNFRDIENFSILTPQLKEDDHTDGSIIYTSYFPGSIFPSFSLIFDEDNCPFSMHLINQLSTDLALILKPQYGYYLQRKFILGPSCYSTGVHFGSRKQTLIEYSKISQWQHARYSHGCYKLGKLRDIYPCNMISQIHLDQPVLNTTLQQWITANSNHGNLHPLTDDLWAWWVEAHQIEPIRHALKDTDLIICDYDLKEHPNKY